MNCWCVNIRKFKDHFWDDSRLFPHFFLTILSKNKNFVHLLQNYFSMDFIKFYSLSTSNLLSLLHSMRHCLLPGVWRTHMSILIQTWHIYDHRDILQNGNAGNCHKLPQFWLLQKGNNITKNDVIVFACTRKSFFTAHFPFPVIFYFQCIWRHAVYSNQYHKIKSHYWMQDIKSYWFCYSFGTNDHAQIILVFLHFLC